MTVSQLSRTYHKRHFHETSQSLRETRRTFTLRPRSVVFLSRALRLTSPRVSPPPVPESPRLGPRTASVAQVVVRASDDAFGVLQLSASAVSVEEDYVGPIINVTRVGGIFADVSVKFIAVPVTARAGKCR